MVLTRSFSLGYSAAIPSEYRGYSRRTSWDKRAKLEMRLQIRGVTCVRRVSTVGDANSFLFCFFNMYFYLQNSVRCNWYPEPCNITLDIAEITELYGLGCNVLQLCGSRQPELIGNEPCGGKRFERWLRGSSFSCIGRLRVRTSSLCRYKWFSLPFTVWMKNVIAAFKWMLSLILKIHFLWKLVKVCVIGYNNQQIPAIDDACRPSCAYVDDFNNSIANVTSTPTILVWQEEWIVGVPIHQREALGK